MNVIPVDMMIFKKDEHQDFLAIELRWMANRYGKPRYGRCKLDKLMQYVRFVRPERLNIDEHLEATDMKNYLTDSWRKGIVKLNSYAPLLSIFPNVSKLGFQHCGPPPSVVPLLLAQISAHPSPIRDFTLLSYKSVAWEENDLILDVLSKNSNKFNGGMESLTFSSDCSMEAIIRFIENGKFAEKFDMTIGVKNDSVEGDSVYVENSGYQKFDNWLRSKGISCDTMQPYDEFVYRSTQFEVNWFFS